MIFVTLGSQKFQFNRLLIKIDELIEDGTIIQPVFAQTGASDYIPKNYAFQSFMDRETFAEYMSRCDTVITHGGTGAIIGAVKNGKKVIAVPRLAKYGEHVDDHQLQIIAQFKEQDLIYAVENCQNLKQALCYVQTHTFQSYQSQTNQIICSIERFLREQYKQ